MVNETQSRVYVRKIEYPLNICIQTHKCKLVRMYKFGPCDSIEYENVLIDQILKFDSRTLSHVHTKSDCENLFDMK